MQAVQVMLLQPSHSFDVLPFPALDIAEVTSVSQGCLTILLLWRGLDIL